MMRRLLALIAVGAMLAAATACDSGDKAAEEGQPDYAVAAASLLSTEEIRNAAEQEDLALVSDLLEAYAEDWRALSPPPELRSTHGRYGDAIAHFADDVEAANAHRVSDAESRFREAFADHYNVETFRVEGAAMEPAYAAGDIVLTCRPDAIIERWQTIVFRLAFDDERLFIKRLVALPGETIEIRDSVILIDGAPVEGDTYALADMNYVVEPLTVPDGRYYVLGDNRRNSFDSHAWGLGPFSDPDPAKAATVPHDLIEGALPPGDAKICPTIAER